MIRLKRQLGDNQLAILFAHEPIADTAVHGLLFKGTLALCPRCRRRRRIDEVDISTPVAVDQIAASCL